MTDTAALALRVQSVGWDAAGDFEWAVVLGDFPPTKHQPWPTYKEVARFTNRADAEAYLALVEWAKEHGYAA